MEVKQCQKIAWQTLKLLIAIIFPWIDTITDGLIVHKWKRLCENNTLECHWWPLGLFFMVLPSIAVAVFTALFFRREGVLGGVLAGVSYILWFPIANIYTNAKILVKICQNQELSSNQKQEKLLWAFGQFFEATFEALPQVSTLKLVIKVC